jgi:aminopeptidase N
MPGKATGLFIACCLLSAQAVLSQPLHGRRDFTHQDTLRGSLNPERTWWDVLKYEITVKPDYNTKTISGVNIITVKILEPGKTMQVDFQEPMVLTSATCGNIPLGMRREGNVYHLDFPALLKKNTTEKIELAFAGKPREAVRPPWDGGWIWKKDAFGNPWMSVACQGLGASVWYPCKDYQGDEPDEGAALNITVPDTLTAVGNGRLENKQDNHNGTTTWTWEVKNPINNYDIIPYIGKYANFTEVFNGEKGTLDCSYWVLDYNLDKAKDQFKQAALMLKCFEYWFGPYPFYEDSYKLVEAPHLGMEHQSATAYGNKYLNGYLGRDLSGTGWGLKWDFIIVHESGHEWFGNNITCKDIADMWIHEGFTNYSESLFTECQYGKEAGSDYVIGTRKSIQNDIPIIGPYGVNQEGSGDMYCKAGNMLHIIRQVLTNDSTFRQILRGLNKTFYHQTVTTQQVENYISTESGIDFSKVFDQYLRTTKIPVLEYETKATGIRFRWTNCVSGFNMPVKINTGSMRWIIPTESWQTLLLPKGYDGKTFEADSNFYIKVKKAESP